MYFFLMLFLVWSINQILNWLPTTDLLSVLPDYVLFFSANIWTRCTALEIHDDGLSNRSMSDADPAFPYNPLKSLQGKIQERDEDQSSGT